MKNFFRSVRYLLPYRARLIGALVCVLAISVLWAGGLSIILPVTRVLITDEGLHGWADQKAVHQALGAVTIRQELSGPLGQADPREPLADVALVTEVDAKGPAAAAGIRPGDWLVGLAEGDDRQLMGFARLHESLADRRDRGDWPLVVRRPDAPLEVVRASPKELDLSEALLADVMDRVPRPRTGIEKWYLLLGLLGLALVATILRQIFRFAQEYMVQSAVYRAMMDIRDAAYAKALQLPLGYFAREGTSDTASRFISDTGELGRGQITLFGKTLVEPGKLVASLVLALLLDWKLTLLACVAGPPVFLLLRRLGKLMRRASKRALEGYSSMLGRLEETLVGLRVVKAYTMEGAERARFRQVNRQLYRQQKRIAAIDAGTSPAVETLGITVVLGVLALAGFWVMNDRPVQSDSGPLNWLLNNRMDPTEFLGIIVLLAAVFDPVRKLSSVANRFHRADAAAARIFELIDQTPEADAPGAAELARHGRDIEFRNVRYSYPGAQQPALRDVELRIEHGQCVAVVGGNGSGKTTLLSLLPRFFAPEAGQVLIDGQDIADVRLESLRRQIGIVTQETVLFHATIAQNIAYGCPDATDEQIRSAARQAFVDEFVQQIPGGYDAVVGEHGATLSGGQRQRIAIARAILRDPAILIFDEATSQIDSESEAKIHQALEQFMAGRTTLLIAHRFSTVVSADRVVVMADGRIVDIGKHDDLVRRCAVYRTLFETQLVGQ